MLIKKRLIILFVFIIFLLNISFSYGQISSTHLITADNSIINVDGERDFNQGAKSGIRLKYLQHHVIFKFDTDGLLDKEIVSAKLKYYRSHSDTIEHITYSTIQSDWNEGSGTGFSISEGGSCFNYAEYSTNENNIKYWAYEGSNFAEVVYGNSYSLLNYSYSQVKSDSTGSYYEWDIDPRIITANVVGSSFGIAILDSSSENKNRELYSEESSRKPVLEITTNSNQITPGAINDLSISSDNIERGEIKLSFTVPSNTFAYDILVSGSGLNGEINIPRYLIPYASQVGTIENIIIKDILTPGQNYYFKVQTISPTGSKSSEIIISGTTSNIEFNPIENLVIQPLNEAVFGYENDDLSVYIIPASDKLKPDGDFVNDVPNNYKFFNSNFNGDKIFLTSGKNDVVAFIVALEAKNTPVNDISLLVNSNSNIETKLSRVGYINTQEGYMPEILYPITSSYKLATNMDENIGQNQNIQQIYIELLIPMDASSGNHEYNLEIKKGNDEVFNIPISHRIWNFEIPNKPNFILEMNDYSFPDYVATYNLLQQTAWKDRAHVNIVPYSQSGSTKMNMVLPSGTNMDNSEYNDISPGDTTGNWDDYNEAFDGMLSGDLFSDGLWQNEPIAGHYSTFFDGWPLNHENYYTSNNDIYQAFENNPEYAQTFVDILKDYVELTKSNNWDGNFQIYLNNKPGGGYSKYTYDEPTSFWDFRANRYYSELVKQGTINKGDVDIQFRIDISRPQWHRNQLKDIIDLHVVGGSFWNYHRLVKENALREDFEIWNYGTANEVYNSNHNEVGWPLMSYAYGATGILPWSTVKTGSQYLSGVTSGDSQKRALYIIETDSQNPKVYSTLRMKAFMRGALDTEYLEILKNQEGLTDGQIENLIVEQIGESFSLATSGAYVEDAGTLNFNDVTEEEFFNLRIKTSMLIEGISTFNFDDDYCFNNNALSSSINQFKSGSISSKQLIDRINQWKIGCI